jgi:hypothetical protein
MQASKRAARPGGTTRPGPTDFSFGPGGPVHKSHWAGRANFFVGSARTDVFILFSLLFIKFNASH